MQLLKLGMQVWVLAIYLLSTGLEGHEARRRGSPHLPGYRDREGNGRDRREHPVVSPLNNIYTARFAFRARSVLPHEGNRHNIAQCVMVGSDGKVGVEIK